MKSTFSFLHRIARLAPGFDSSGHRHDVRVSHLPQGVGGEGRAESPSAIKDDPGPFIRDHRFDVALQHPPADMPGARGVIDAELVVFTDVDEMKRGAGVELRLD